MRKVRFLTISLGVLLAASMPLAAEEKKEDIPGAVAEATKRLDVAQVKEARKALDPVAGKASENAGVALALGRLYEMEKKSDDAVDMVKKAAAMTPADPGPMVVLGEMLQRANKATEAGEAFKKAEELAAKVLEADLKSGAARLSLAIAQQRSKKYEEAEKNLALLRESDPGNVQVFYRTGLNFAFQQKWQDSVDYLTKSLEKDSAFAYSYYYRALSQEKLGKKDRLVLDMDKFLKLAPDAPEASRAKQIVQAAKR